MNSSETSASLRLGGPWLFVTCICEGLADLAGAPKASWELGIEELGVAAEGGVQ